MRGANDLFRLVPRRNTVLCLLGRLDEGPSFLGAFARLMRGSPELWGCAGRTTCSASFLGGTQCCACWVASTKAPRSSAPSLGSCVDLLNSGDARGERLVPRRSSAEHGAVLAGSPRRRPLVPRRLRSAHAWSSWKSWPGR